MNFSFKALAITAALAAMPTAYAANFYLAIPLVPASYGDTSSLTVSLSAMSLPSGFTGKAYSADLRSLLSIKDDHPVDLSAVRWSVVHGNLPAGLALSQGVISGMPRAAQVTNFTVKAQYKSKAGMQSFDVPVELLTVNLDEVALPDGVVGVEYPGIAFGPLVRSSDPDFAQGKVSWTALSGLPPGLALDPDKGVLAGTPSSAFEGSLAVQARYHQAVGERTYPLAIRNGIELSGQGRRWSDGSYASNCAGYRNPEGNYAYAGATGDGVYTISAGGELIDVHCDQTRDGGGWMLIQAQVGATFTKMLSANASPVLPSAAAAHRHLNKIVQVATQIRWTDTSNTRFHQAKTNLPLWFNKITSQPCNAAGNTIDVYFEDGWFNTATTPRKVEACTSYVWGMRNNKPYSSFNDIEGFAGNTTMHMCWYDEVAADRPFMHNTSTQATYCNQFGYAFDPAMAKRGGSMNYLVWLK
ncbi:putative Ig domain-containing protein [Comamonas thiooxydans]|uniref:putative Ig domain-containing protein n=1 Tax=Comamonas thiooxydans TaxID=363952 RepID=UPI000B412121|nr:putative Ig domain-containing protein [Comamonas thiooxydans]